MEKIRNLEELMNGQREGESEELSVRIQILKDGEVVDEITGNAFIGELIVEKEGETFHRTCLGGKFITKDLIVAGYAIRRYIDAYIDDQNNPLAELAKLFAGTD